jgi:hypothetical protein
MVPQSEYLEEGLVILSLQNQLGNIGLSAAELGLSRGELMEYLVRHPAVMETRKQIREAIKDTAEDLLFEKMKTDNSLLIFYLRTQAKDRGYDTSHSNVLNNNVNVNVDARSLIAAMRTGIKAIEAKEDEESISEEGDFFPISELHADGTGS